MGPAGADLHISDGDLPQGIEASQLRLMDERGIDMTIFSPRAWAAQSHPAWNITRENP